jgi:hypothetical protein
MKRLSLFTSTVFLALSGGAAIAEPDLSGIWMISSFAKEGELVMTDEALALQAGYDLLSDDPSLYCEPASVSRVWANPNVRIAFEQSADELQINYEFFDLRRSIPIGDASALSASPSTVNVSGVAFGKMGSSFARYDGDRLIIETRNHTPGFIRTSSGVPQSEQTISVEELWVEGGRLMLRQTYVDETLFEKPFVLDYAFERIDESVLPLYECTDANYDWFEKLNAPGEEERR